MYSRSAGELVWLNSLIALAVTVLVFALSGAIVGKLFGSIADDIAASARDYLFYTAFSIPAIGLFEAGTSIFRTMGDTRTTMKTSLLMNALNCAGNAVLIYGLNMGAAGAAISTTVSRWVAAVLIIALLLSQKRELHLERSLRHRFDWRLVRQIARVGIPGGAVQLAVVTVISRCVGTGEYEQAKYYDRRFILLTMLANLALGSLMYLGLPLILRLYTLSAETTAMIGSMFLWHTIGAAVLWPLSFAQAAALRAAGDVRYPMILSIVSMWVFRFGGAYLLAYGFNLGAVGIWVAMSMLDWGFRAVFYALRWCGGKWRSMNVT